MTNLGVEPRDLRKGDKIIGLGTVARSWKDEDGDWVVRLEPPGSHLGMTLVYDEDAWLRIERDE